MAIQFSIKREKEQVHETQSINRSIKRTFNESTVDRPINQASNQSKTTYRHLPCLSLDFGWYRFPADVGPESCYPSKWPEGLDLASPWLQLRAKVPWKHGVSSYNVNRRGKKCMSLCVDFLKKSSGTCFACSNLPNGLLQRKKQVRNNAKFIFRRARKQTGLKQDGREHHVAALVRSFVTWRQANVGWWENRAEAYAARDMITLFLEIITVKE